MKRRTPGAGGVDQLPSGRWRVRIRDDNGKQMSLGAYDTEAEAEAVRKAGLLDLKSRQADATGPLTLRAWGNTWRARRIADGIRGADKEWLVWGSRVLASDLADLPVRDLTRRHVVAWIDHVRAAKVVRSARGKGRVATEKTVAQGTVRHALHVLRSALRMARDASLLVGDPTEGVKIPKGKRSSAIEPWTWLRADEAERAAEERLGSWGPDNDEAIKRAICERLGVSVD